jgi:hypothetical protein
VSGIRYNDSVILMYTVSPNFLLSPRIIIHNQCSSIKLALSAYFGNGVVYPELSDQQIDIGTTMAYFEINTTQDDFEGALLFRLQRYSDGQSNRETSTTETSEAKYIQMLVIWKVKDTIPFAHVLLVGHTKEFTWNENDLKQLYDKNYSRLREYDDIMPSTWHMDDNMILKAIFRVRSVEKNFELSISISEEEKDDYAIRPLYVDLER